MNSGSLVERFSDYLNKILIQSRDSFIKQKHQEWLESTQQGQAQGLSFY